MKDNSKKVLYTNYRSIHTSWLSTDQVGLSNNNPHWKLDFRFLFFPDLIQVLRDLKVTHPSLERLESDSSKSRETWKWLIQVLRDLKVTHPSLENDSSKSRETWKWLIQVTRGVWKLGMPRRLTVSRRGTPSFHTPLVTGVGEDARQKILISQFFNRWVVVWVRHEGLSSIPHLGYPVSPGRTFSQSTILPEEKFLVYRRGKYPAWQVYSGQGDTKNLSRLE